MHGRMPSKEKPMEKFGVEVDSSKTKTASDEEKQLCPVCGRELEKSGNNYINKCPVHGTEPFEKKP
jgi:tRNA(Ile2) C34 agmatinyltransferase TiaS